MFPPVARQGVVASLLYLTTLGLAYSQKEHSCDGGTICLTSFVWCDTNYEGGKRACDYGDDALAIYPIDFIDPDAIIDGSKEHKITWTGADTDYPVMVSWGFTADFPEWSTNTTDPSVIFTPFDVVDNDRLGAIRDVHSYITVSQPKKPGYPKTEGSKSIEWRDTGQPFFVRNSPDLSEAKYQRQIGQREAEDRWSKGVKIGAGVGAPLLFIVTATVTYFLTSRHVKSKERKASRN